MMKVKQALDWGSQELISASDSPQLDAEILLREASGLTTAQQIAKADEQLADVAINTYQGLIAERVSGTPIAYLLGLREFYSLDFIVSPDVLIPRPETELLVDTALASIPKQGPYRVLDLGTGSGAIAISLAHHRPEAEVVAVEQSAAALAVARQNAIINRVEHVQFFQGSWFEPLPADNRFDLIVSNPPYIDADDPHLLQGDVRFEPRAALVAANKGIADYETIIAAAANFLTANGQLMFEHGCDQGNAVTALLSEAGFAPIKTLKDFAGRDRITAAHTTLS